MTMVVSSGIGVILDTFLFCRPFARIWNALLPGTCGSATANVLSTSIANMIVDTMIILLPMPVVWRLQMSTKKKVYLTVIFGLGLVYVLASRIL